MHGDRFSIALLALAGGITRLPFVVGTPVNWDAVQFALALDRFDLHLHQPHPPGYILYVVLGRMMQLFTGDPTIALSMLSVIFSALSAPLLYLLTVALLEDRAVAWGATFLFLASPLALYYGAVGLTYLPEMAVSMGVAWIAWRAVRSPGIGAAAALGMALGTAGGLRQPVLIVLLPLCLWAIWGAGVRVWGAFTAGFVPACLMWLVPLLIWSGGVEAYLRESALLADAAAARTSLFSAGVEGLLHNLLFIVLALTLGVGLGVLPLGLWAARLLSFSLARRLRSFLLWWTLPPLAFYALTHVGQYGYLLVVLPPLLIVSALGARVFGEILFARRKKRGAGLGVAICGALAVPAAAYFLLAQGPITAQAIWGNDAHWGSLRATLQKMDPKSTVLITQVKWQAPFRLAGYLLPQFHTYAIGSDAPGSLGPKGWLYEAYGGVSTYALPHPTPQSTLSLPPDTRRVVALDGETAEMLRGEYTLITVSPGEGDTLYILESQGMPIDALTIDGDKIRRIP